MKSLATALIEAQKEMPPVERNATNPHFGSKFVSLDHLIAKTKPVLTKHGLAIVQLPDNCGGTPGLKTILIHASGEQVESTVPLVLGKQDMQGLGAALTYARRYGWASALGISDEDDDDGNSASAPSMGAAPKASAGDVAASASGRAAASSPAGSAAAPQFVPPADPNRHAASGPDGDWVWPSGKHVGTKLADTPLEYVMWYAEKGPKPDVRARCAAFITPDGGSFFDGDHPDSDVPFLPTIDGLGN